MTAKNSTKKGLVFVGLGIEAVVLIVGAVFLGQKVDQLMAWQGTATVSLLMASVVLWFLHFIKLVWQFKSKK